MSSTTRSTLAVLHRARQRLDEVTDGDGPRGVVTAEVLAGVGLGDLGEVLPTLERVHPTGLADGPQQRHRQRSGADPGLDDDRTREHVGHHDDLAGVLGIDHRGAPGHRHHVVGEQRAQREVLDAGGVLDRRAVRGTDQVVVGEVPPVGVELLARGQGDGVHAALGVGQLDALARGEGATPQLGAGR
jgi:hypothetical protein